MSTNEQKGLFKISIFRGLFRKLLVFEFYFSQAKYQNYKKDHKRWIKKKKT